MSAAVDPAPGHTFLDTHAVRLRVVAIGTHRSGEQMAFLRDERGFERRTLVEQMRSWAPVSPKLTKCRSADVAA
ncbi:MAG: hypothetical protein V4755_11330 [Curtobacterium sp.]